MKTVTSTDAARGLGDLIAEVGRSGEEVLITRNGTAVARLSPATESRTATLAEFLDVWQADASLPPDPGFAADLERVQQADAVPDNPWRSSSTRRR